MAVNDQKEGQTINRRELMGGLAAAAGAGLAGCLGGDEEVDAEGLGERVPGLNIDFFATLGKINEDYAEMSMQDLTEGLDLNLEATGREHTAHVNDLYSDARQSLLPLYIYATEIDPHFTTIRMMADQAGDGLNTAGQNTAQWANCDFSVRADAQVRATDREERERLVNEAWSILSHDCAMIPISSQANIRGVRTSEVEPDENVGITQFNPKDVVNYLQFSPAGSDVLREDKTGTTMETLNPYTFTSQSSLWNNMVSMPLLTYDKTGDSIDIVNNLAASVDVADNNNVTVEIKEATFHNGDPITAEDVKFTYDYLIAGARAGAHQFSPPVNELEEITIVDDRTVEFVMNEPYAPLTDREFVNWGIQHKASWMSALEEHGVDSFDSLETDFENFSAVQVSSDFVGSGWFILDNFETGRSITMTATDKEHPVYGAPECDITFINRRDSASRLAAFQSGDINVASLAAGQIEQVEGEDDVTIVSEPYIQNFAFFTPNCAVAPTKFVEFRKAVAMTLNRQEMVSVSQRDLIEPDMYSILYAHNHPWRPPDDMLYRMAEDETGNPESARELLEEAGWGWDSNDNLRYPEGADLEMLWEEGGHPDPDDYPCLNEDGFQVPEGYEMTEDQVPGYDN